MPEQIWGSYSMPHEGVSTKYPLLSPCRRFVWNFFRLENEHLNNCGQFRAVRDISIKPDKEKEEENPKSMEAMMDEESQVPLLKHKESKGEVR